MSREDFMRQLEMLLADVPQEEKQEALSYYQSYFEDAGTENEARILRELDSPQKVAATIKADLGMEAGESVGEYTEHGFMDSRFQDRQEIKVAVEPSREQAGKAQGAEEKGKPGAYQREGETSGYQNQGTYRQEEEASSYQNQDTYGQEEEASSYQDQSTYGQGGEAFGSQEQGGYRQGEGNSNYQRGYRPEGNGSDRDASGQGESAGYQQGNGTGGNNGYRSASGYAESGGYQEGSRSRGDGSYWEPFGNGGSGDYGDPSGTGGNTSYGNRSRSTYNGSQLGRILLLVAIAVLTSPAWLGLLGGVGGLVIGLAVTVVCLTGAFFIVGGVLFGVGIGQMATGSLAIGFALSGVGMLTLALAILCTLFCVWVCGKLFPWFLRAVRGLWRGFFSRKEQRL